MCSDEAYSNFCKYFVSEEVAIKRLEVDEIQCEISRVNSHIGVIKEKILKIKSKHCRKEAPLEHLNHRIQDEKSILKKRKR